MGRKKNTMYVDAAVAVLTEIGGGPVRSKDLVKIALEKGLVPEGDYTYHYILKAVRDNSDIFDASKRGYVTLLPSAVPAVAADAEEAADVELADFATKSVG